MPIERPSVEPYVGDAMSLREAGREWLSLALIDARNRSLRLFAACDDAPAASLRHAPDASRPLDPPLWTLGHVGWYQEYWIARNVQRQRGERCAPRATRLASIETQADFLYDPSTHAADMRESLPLPDAEATRAYLLETLDTTLELLEVTPSDDAAALYFFRLALAHEDLAAEAFAVWAQAYGVGASALRELWPELIVLAPREPLRVPAMRGLVGMPRDAGFVFDNEMPAHRVDAPPFEIDAQPVSWAQYAEFVEDGGYDEPSWWSAAGLAWLERTGRRAPRHVEQWRQGVLARCFGEVRRVPAARACVHVSFYEAEAWCRWAGRRLPVEVEWEFAASREAPHRFRWGEVLEWTASTFRPYPGHVPGPDASWSQAAFGTHRAVRGASFATPSRLRHAKFRRWLLADEDEAFVGFRSCALVQ